MWEGRSAIDQLNRHRGIVYWGIFGFLVADLFTALAMLFLVSNTQGHFIAAPTPTLAPTSTPTPRPIVCGIDINPAFQQALTVSDDNGLRNGDATARSALQAQVRQVLDAYKSRTAGLVEIGGGGTVGEGQQLSQGVIQALNRLGQQGFIFTTDRTLFQGFWNGDLASNQFQMNIWFYVVSQDGRPCL